MTTDKIHPKRKEKVRKATKDDISGCCYEVGLYSWGQFERVRLERLEQDGAHCRREKRANKGPH